MNWQLTPLGCSKKAAVFTASRQSRDVKRCLAICGPLTHPTATRRCSLQNLGFWRVCLDRSSASSENLHLQWKYPRGLNFSTSKFLEGQWTVNFLYYVLYFFGSLVSVPCFHLHFASCIPTSSLAYVVFASARIPGRR